jgi:hypothetical protein
MPWRHMLQKIPGGLPVSNEAAAFPGHENDRSIPS